MLEETIIRESATNKLQSRVGASNTTGKSSDKVIGPPVSFFNPVTDTSLAEQMFGDEGNSSENTIDHFPSSPLKKRSGTVKSIPTNMVPQE